MSDFILGDCMEYMKDMADNEFELAIVDPPYGLERLKKINKGDKIHSEKDRGKNYNNSKPTNEYFSQLFRVSINQIVWGGNNFNLPPSEYFLIWDKKQGYPNFARCEYAWVSMGLKKPAKIYEYSIHQQKPTDKIHPIQKPVALYKWLLKNYAKPGDKILDTHVGSASSLIACYQMGFEYLGFEIDEEYYNKAVERLEQVKAQTSIFDLGISHFGGDIH